MWVTIWKALRKSASQKSVSKNKSCTKPKNIFMLKNTVSQPNFFQLLYFVIGLNF